MENLNVNPIPRKLVVPTVSRRLVVPQTVVSPIQPKTALKPTPVSPKFTNPLTIPTVDPQTNQERLVIVPTRTSPIRTSPISPLKIPSSPNRNLPLVVPTPVLTPLVVPTTKTKPARDLTIKPTPLLVVPTPISKPIRDLPTTKPLTPKLLIVPTPVSKTPLVIPSTKPLIVPTTRPISPVIKPSTPLIVPTTIARIVPTPLVKPSTKPLIVPTTRPTPLIKPSTPLIVPTTIARNVLTPITRKSLTPLSKPLVIQTRNNIDSLPDDILFNVLTDSDSTEIKALCSSTERLSKFCEQNKQLIWSKLLLRDFDATSYSGDIIKYYDMLNVTSYGIGIKIKNDIPALSSLSFLNNLGDDWYNVDDGTQQLHVTIEIPGKKLSNQDYYVVMIVKTNIPNSKQSQTNIFTLKDVFTDPIEAREFYNNFVPQQNWLIDTINTSVKIGNSLFCLVKFNSNGPLVVTYNNYLLDMTVKADTVIHYNLANISKPADRQWITYKTLSPSVNDLSKIMRIVMEKRSLPITKGTICTFVYIDITTADGDTKYIKEANYFDDNIYNVNPDMTLTFVRKTNYINDIPEGIVTHLEKYPYFLETIISNASPAQEQYFETAKLPYDIYQPYRDEETTIKYGYILAFLSTQRNNNIFHFDFYRDNLHYDAYYGYIKL